MTNIVVGVHNVHQNFVTLGTKKWAIINNSNKILQRQTNTGFSPKNMASINIGEKSKTCQTCFRNKINEKGRQNTPKSKKKLQKKSIEPSEKKLNSKIRELNPRTNTYIIINL